MRSFTRRVLFAVVLASLWRPPLGVVPAAGSAPAASKTLLLSTSEPDVSKPRADGGLLLREILRQAILLAARDELGLSTRDATLREIPRSAPGSLDVRTSVVRGDQCRVIVERGPADKREVVWQAEFPLADEPINYHKLVTAMEKHAREAIPQALQRAGYPAVSRPKAPPRGGRTVADMLDTLELTSQFAALRSLHLPGPAEGELDRLGGLARAYANLGQLTAFHWGAGHKAFRARALLYAERLVAKYPNSPAAHWHHAYAQALTGFPGVALESLSRASKLRADLPEGRRPPEPAWVGLLDMFCRRDFTRLLPATRKGRPAEGLATLLAYLTLEEEGRNATFVQFTRKAAEAHPELYRLHDGFFASGQLGLMNAAALIGPNTLNNTIADRINALPNLPFPAVEKGAVELTEVATRVPPVVKALIDAGKPGKDAAEPSWALLGRMLEDLQFAQTARTARLQRKTLGLSADDLKSFVRAAMPAIADHPLRDFIVAHSIDNLRHADVYRGMLQGLPLAAADVGPAAAHLIADLQAIDTPKKGTGREMARLLRLHLDATADDLSDLLRLVPAKSRPAYARELLKVSPHSPQSIVTLIELDWANVRDKAAQWEKDYASSPSVLVMLGRRYVQLKQPADAERCLRAAARLSPDRPTFRALADIYKAQGDTARWIEALENYLKTEDLGLAHAQVRVELARHFMASKQFDKAKPYADAAAETAAGWAMMCAAEVEEGLKNYPAAEKWVRETAEHYPTSRHLWLFWCVRTGKGDLDAARKLALGWAERSRGTRGGNTPILSCVCFVLCDKPADGFEMLQPLQRGAAVNPQLALHAALLADELGKKKERDELLAKVVKQTDIKPKPVNPKVPAPKVANPAAQARTATLFKGCGELARLFTAALAASPGGERIDLKKIDEVIAAVDPTLRGNAKYLAARFLELHGHPTEAQKLYKETAAAGTQVFSVALASYRLRAARR
jgi:tetratricopeptide (TPR) repeat protein